VRYRVALYNAQTAELCAIAALESHKKQHKCWASGYRDPLFRR
jgi:hypothetical protein